jgi:argininosuccinate synthase
VTFGRKLGRLLYEGKWYDPESMMLKEALARWVAPSITGEVTLELRRGEDYSILDTRAAHMSYDPQKLSMEKVESAFSPEDRMGALEMQNLSVLDGRDFLLNHLETTRLLPTQTTPQLEALLGTAVAKDGQDSKDGKAK